VAVTLPEVLPDMEAAKRGVGDVKVREHLQLCHLVGHLEEHLRVHLDFQGPPKGNLLQNKGPLYFILIRL